MPTRPPSRSFFRALPALILGLSPSVAATADAPPPAAPPAGAARVQDFCLGDGSPGPYALRWKHVTPDSETVQVNGLPQARGLDYTLDADAGTVTFTRDLPARSAAEITYGHDAAQAERGGGNRAIPLSLDLLRGEHGFFSLDALGRPGDSAGGDLTLGIGLGVRGGGPLDGQLSSRFAFTPVTAAGVGDESLSRRAGLSIKGSATGGGWALLSFGFSQAGVGLQNAGDDDLQAGQQVLSLNGHLTPIKPLTAEVSFRRSTPTDGLGAAGASDLGVALTLAANATTQVKASLDRSDGAGAGGETQTAALSVDAHPGDKVALSASFDGKDAPGTSGDTQALGLKAVLTPSQSLSLDLDAGRSRQGGGAADRQSVLLSLDPRASVHLSAGLALRQTRAASGPATPGSTVASVGGTLRPLSFLEFSGGFKSRLASGADADAQNQYDTSTARVSLSPLPTLHLTGTYAQNPDDAPAAPSSDNLQRLARRGVGLETSLGALGLSGGLDWSRRYDSADVERTVHADLGLRFSAATQLSVGFQSRDTLDSLLPAETAYTVGFTHDLGDRFRLSLSGKRAQSADAASADYNASADLGIKL